MNQASFDQDPINENWLRIMRAQAEGDWDKVKELSGGVITGPSEKTKTAQSKPKVSRSDKSQEAVSEVINQKRYGAKK